MSATAATAVKHKILLLDDDPDVLNLYQQVLLQLPSEPEVHIATSGASALAMLDAESFNLLVSDLSMPRMDGLQVLAIVRRKFPQLRTVVLTGVADDQMRGRAYAMGIDLYLEKPKSEKEMKFFTDCLESLIDSENSGGFLFYFRAIPRGVKKIIAPPRNSRALMFRAPILIENSLIFRLACFASRNVCNTCAETISSDCVEIELEIVRVTTFPSRSTV